MTAAETPNALNSCFRVGLVQMCSGRDVDANVRDASAFVREAVAGGAQYVQTPEVTTFMELDREALIHACEPEEGNRALQAFQALADELGVWLHIGSMAVALDGAEISDSVGPRFANRSFLIGPDGRIAARYDKIHMFDVTLSDAESYMESENYLPGERAVVAKLPWGGLGLTICYDLRFSHLHRRLAHAGASFIAAPAAFAVPTGEAHWHVLVRARAIEAQCFVFAAAQGGQHEHGRQTYGHSLIVSPWGDILAEGGSEPGVIWADIDLAVLRDVRGRVPSLRHDREFETVSQVEDLKAVDEAG